MLNRFLEFFIVGLILGVLEDLIAISLATEKEIDLRVFVIAFFVAFPFAVFSELIVDHDKFRKLMSRWFKRS
ncbi:MAG: hypothetical protein Q8P92_01320 [Candidatus Daviesbacteria bacterium]|nr:hypothetical protein [Candidatus Daviesbacteria bacterium]